MKRLLFFILAGTLALASTGCVKVDYSVDFKNDATATVEASTGYSISALDSIAMMVERMGEQMGDTDEVFKALDVVKDFGSEKAVQDSLKKNGAEVTSCKATEAGGWKTVEVKANVKDVNALLAAAASNKQEATSAGPGPDTSMMQGLNGVRFYKTDQAGVGEIEIVPAPPADRLAKLDELEDEDGMNKEMAEAMFEQLRTQFALNDMSVKMKMALPGKVLSTTGCKKTGEQEVTFTFSGASITISGMKDAFGMKDGVRATFQIPEGCKIKFEDKKAKTEKKKDAAADEKKEGGEEKKEKKGGLTIEDK